MQDQSLDWGKCVGLCTEGAASMIGCHSSATIKIRKVANKKLLPTHCIIHCKRLAAQKLSPELNDVIIQAVNSINYIRDRVLHLRLFEALFVSMAAQNRHLIFHTEVDTLLWEGHVLALFFDLR